MNDMFTMWHNAGEKAWAKVDKLTEKKLRLMKELQDLTVQIDNEREKAIRYTMQANKYVPIL